jgi:HAD superfamily hydrolase (TIGR01509 family)
MAKSLQALIFDFDGLVVDTETARYYAWKEVIESEGVPLPLSVWLENIGLPSEAFDPLAFLEKRAEKPIDGEAVRERKREVFKARMVGESLRPGVREYFDEARERDLKLAICSSSPRSWVDSNLNRYGIDGIFDGIVTGSDVENIKPHPELYLKAVEVLSAPIGDCIALEDSAKGVESAKAAGLFCVAVGNPITKQTDLGEADIVLSSLAEMPLEMLEKKFLSA